MRLPGGRPLFFDLFLISFAIFQNLSSTKTSNIGSIAFFASLIPIAERVPLCKAITLAYHGLAASRISIVYTAPHKPDGRCLQTTNPQRIFPLSVYPSEQWLHAASQST